MRRAVLTGVLVAALGGAAAAPGGAAAGDPAVAVPGHAGVFAISPARSELIGRGAMTLDPTAVSNTTGHPLRVSVAPVLLRQGPSGAFTWSRSPAALRAARRRLAVSVSRFTLGGHASHTVLTRWTGAGDRRPSYVGILYRGVPLHPRGQLRIITQLLDVNLRGVPGAGPARGRITGLTVSEPVTHRLRFTVAVRNTGHTYGTPLSVSLAIRTAAGRRVLALPITPGVILPGVTRDFSVVLPRRLAGGRYRATAGVRFAGAGTSRRTLAFRLDAAGDLPTPELVPGAPSAGGTGGQHAWVSIPLRNAGSASGAPRGTVSLYRMAGAGPTGRPVAVAALRGSPVGPGARGTAGVHLGQLRGGGEYQAVIRYAAPIDASAPAIVDFRAGVASSALSRILSWLSRHALVLGLAAALAASLGTAGRARLRPRRPDAEPIRLHRM